MTRRRHNLLRRDYLALVACLLATCVAQAAVTTTGQVDPTDPTTWTSFTEAYIGGFSASLSVDGGSDIESFTAYLGYDYGNAGVATVTGAGSAWNNSANMYVGHLGAGTLNILNGAAVSSVSSYVGYGNSVASGLVAVDGVGTTWNNRDVVEVGGYGAGMLRIQDGAVVSVGLDTIVQAETTASGQIHLDNGTLNTGGLIASEDQISGVGTINSRGLVSDVALTFNAANALEQQLLFDSLPGQSVTLNLNLAGEDNGSLGAGYKEVGSLVIADGVSINSWRGFVGYHLGSQGSATVTGAGSSWAISDTLYVGHYGAGTLNIEDGAEVSTGHFNSYVGYFGAGEAVITDAGSTWRDGDELFVGYYGTGKMRIENGGNIIGQHVYIGNGDLTTKGEAIVTGTGSAWFNGGRLYLGGHMGSGTLRVEEGALVTSRFGYLAPDRFSKGEATITGAGSAWDMTSDLVVGVLGTATVNIENGAAVINYAGAIGNSSGASGAVSVTGSGSTWQNYRNLNVGIRGAGTLTISGGGAVVVGSPDNVRDVALGLLEGSGVLTIDDGVLRLHGGNVTQGAGSATFNFNGGRLEGVGTYQVGAGLTQNGGVLAPGNSTGITTIVGSYILNSGALEIELLSGSGVAGTAFDRLVVNSGVTLGVSSQLNLLLGYAANVGDSFLIVDSKNSAPINGTFANNDTPTAEYESLRYSFSLSYAAGTGNDIAVTVASVALIGDYNADGFVDAADYTVWQDAVGTTVAAYVGADGNGDGVVDEDDHAVWAAHYGASLEAAMAEAVPEPAGVVLAVLTLIAGGRRSLRSRGLCSAS
jgi:fibronectin-binding autotransporter adhesin